MKELKAVLIGSRGHWGYFKNAVERIDRINWCAYSTGCEDSPQRVADAAAEMGKNIKIYDDYREMLDVEKPDVAVIDGPFHLHAEMCCEVLKRNIHCFCEKPIALTLEDLKRIEDTYKNCAPGVEIISMVGLRAEPAFLTAYRYVQQGAIGKVKMVNTRKSYKLGNRPAFYKERATYGGTIPWVGSHALDWVLWFSGAKSFKSIHAVHSTSDNRDHGELEMTALVSAVMDNGVLASASIDYLRPSTAPTHGDDRVRVAGTDGVIEVMHREVKLINSDGEQTLEQVPERGIFYDFALHLLDGEEALVDAAQTFELTRACLVARDTADVYGDIEG